MTFTSIIKYEREYSRQDFYEIVERRMRRGEENTLTSLTEELLPVCECCHNVIVLNFAIIQGFANDTVKFEALYLQGDNEDVKENTHPA